MLDKELIKNIETEDYVEKKKPINRIYIVTITLILLVLISLNFLGGSQIINHINSKLASSTIDKNLELNIKFGGKVVLSNHAYNKLKIHYLDNQKNEIKACLLGEKKGKNYIVNDLYFPKIISQTVHSVRSELCNDKTIISLHSHPYFSCLFSKQDIRSFQLFKKVNPDGIYGLMCDVDRFTFYGYEQ